MQIKLVAIFYISLAVSFQYVYLPAVPSLNHRSFSLREREREKERWFNERERELIVFKIYCDNYVIITFLYEYRSNLYILLVKVKKTILGIFLILFYTWIYWED